MRRLELWKLLRLLVVLQFHRLGSRQYVFGAGCVIHGAVGQQDELAGLQRRLVLQYAVLRDAQAVQAGSKRARPPTTTAPSSAPTIQLTSGPPPGAAPDRGPKRTQNEEQSPHPTPEGAVLPHTLMRSPTL